MAGLEEIKKIIAPLLNDENSADVIEQLSSLQLGEVDNTEVIEKAISERDVYWNERFRNTFLGGLDEEEQEEIAEVQEEELTSLEEENLTFEALFEEEEE